MLFSLVGPDAVRGDVGSPPSAKALSVLESIAVLGKKTNWPIRPGV